MTNGLKANEAALREAAGHLVDADRRGLRAEEDPAFNNWRDQDHARAASAARVMQVWDDASELKMHSHYGALLGKPTLRERIVAAIRSFDRPVFTPARTALATGCVALLVVAGTMLFSPASPQYRTEVAEVREFRLADGSEVTLGAKSEIAKVMFSSEARRVKMGTGEAFFAVTKNPKRPFLVQAGDALIRVVGTKFNVKYDGTKVKVSVLEGVVEVIRPGGAIETVSSAAGQPHVTLKAGQQAIVSEAKPGLAVQASVRIDPGSWREGRLSYEDAALSDVIADANRYRSGEIVISSPDLGRERINSSFKTSQIDQMLDSLPDSINARVIRHPDGRVEIRRR